LRTAILMGPRRQALVAEAAAALLVARTRTAISPFAAIGRRLGAFVPPDDARATASRGGGAVCDTAAARRIGWAVRTVAPLMPFRSACLQQAIAAHAMLARRGIAGVTHFGVRRGDPEPAETHVWLGAAGACVVGYPIGTDIVEIGCFV
jgi:hypothetical protein